MANGGYHQLLKKSSLSRLHRAFGLAYHDQALYTAQRGETNKLTMTNGMTFAEEI